MSTAYFDCYSGISGDMALGALLDCGADRAVLDAAVEALQLQDEISVEVRRESRGHVGGTRVVVQIGRQKERTIPALRATVEQSSAPDAVKRQALKAIGLLAAAEGALHGVAENDLHLHELGGADTLVDVV
ncbi:MAG TPA: nickel insertion protein, partial [Candidatus Udaeobacter sp.]|nr:nickel insertion protein [Candidatus Udaeobacter sp.]